MPSFCAGTLHRLSTTRDRDGGESPSAAILRSLRSEIRNNPPDVERDEFAIDDSVSLDTISIELPTLPLTLNRPRPSHSSVRASHLDPPCLDKVMTLEIASGLLPHIALTERTRRRSELPGINSNLEDRPSKVADLEDQVYDVKSEKSPRVTGEDVASQERLQSATELSRFRRNSRIQFAALCWCIFLEGWNDGTTGPMIPAFQRYYNIGFATVSCIFILNCVGFLSGAVANVWLNDKLGLGKVLVLGSLCQIVAYAMLAPAGPFPLMIVAYGIAGFGISLQNAQACGFVASLKEHASTKMCVLHACYGLGAFTAPLVATHFANTRHWSFHFLISVGIAISNTALLTAVFRFRTQDDVMAKAGQGPGEVGTGGGSQYRQLMGQKALHLLAFFALIYVGVEVTIGGWSVTFIERERHGGPSSGYVSSGFFGGMTVGRLALIWLNRKVGERRILFFYAIAAMALEVTVWLVPDLIQNAIAVSFVGLLLGPMYPILANHATKILPAWLLTSSMGWIAGFGQAGSALFPFTSGILAAKYGIGSLQPLVVVMMTIMVVIWAIVPNGQRRVD
ncbi:hypothetical protein JAAARDRAFT_669074 [Jaapia argillacea MUCL 33604]|uniref:Major facilitator superfamily (MFS) profile domain-containing protein n=1 Tax=Jaapia argillacea MUCL 33604 TaxID=933084 RepID=A0A067PUT4_9AGAM|nr:hypothetical protein JAAARDRAFT_669074 [Jaapia argillacea MUCL 33604]